MNRFLAQVLDGDCHARPPVAGVRRDSRKVVPGDAFIAIADGDLAARHIAQARAQGASIVVGAEVSSPHPRWCHARASAASLGTLPPLVGITGTDGKTSVAWLVRQALGAGAASVGTLGWYAGDEHRSGAHTTPPPEELHAFLRQLPADCPGVALECSSHALHQQRLAGLPLQLLVISSIGSDHLDYHREQAAYVMAKLAAFALVAPDGLVLYHADDPRAPLLRHAATMRGLRSGGLGVTHGDARIVDGVSLVRDGQRFAIPAGLPGAHNRWNIAVAALAAEACGVAIETALARLAEAPGIPGRLERLADAPATYVDYAHTAAGIERALAALRAHYPGARLVCVFGCGGDRDRSKRPLMARAASAADLCVITNDNPRSEDPEAIVTDILAGIPVGAAAPVVELDRGAAIRLARECAGSDGVVVVCGKGHETEQVFADRREAWDDRAFVRSCGGAP